MHVARAQAVPVTVPFRLFAIVVTLAVASLAALPVAQSHAQAAPSGGAAEVASAVPESALFFAYASFDLEGAQPQLAAQLFERAGLTEDLGHDMMLEGTDEIPAGAELGVVVTSLPETPSVSAAEVSLDPLAATEGLDEGGYALLIGTDDPQGAYDTLLADLDSNVDVSESEIATADYNGVTITSYSPEEGDTFTDPTAIALVGEYAVQAARPEDIEPIIDTVAGNVPALSQNANFQSLTSMLPAEHLALGFINGPATLEAIETSSPEVTQSLDQRSTDLLDSWTAFSFSAEQAGFRLETRSIANATPFDEMTPLDGSFLDQVPADSLLVVNGNNIDATGIVTSLAFLLAVGIMGEDPFATPVAADTMPVSQDEAFTQAESLLGFNLKTDFVDQLVGEFGFAISVDGSITDMMTPPAVNALLVSEVEDTVAVQDVVSKLSFIIGAGMGDAGAIETRDVNGSQVNVVDLTETGVAERAEFGVVDGELVISVGDGLDDYLGGVDAPLSQDPNFSAVMEQLPTDYGSVVYVNMPVVLSLATDLNASFSGAGITDADPACGDFMSQQEAQVAYEEDQFANFLLDQDFDGEACEDFFDPPSATPAVAGNPYPNVIGLGSVSTQEAGVNGTTTFLLIGGE